MDGLTVAAIAAVAVAVPLAALFLLIRAKRDADECIHEVQRKTPGDVCGICFGAISKEDVIARCGCGQAFHDFCAEPTGACPYCETPYGDLLMVTPDCVVCPACGADVIGSVCGCGAVVNRDGTFTCRCGNRIDVNDPVCGRCGTEYDVCKGRGA